MSTINHKLIGANLRTAYKFVEATKEDMCNLFNYSHENSLQRIVRGEQPLTLEQYCILHNVGFNNEFIVNGGCYPCEEGLSPETVLSNIKKTIELNKDE